MVRKTHRDKKLFSKVIIYSMEISEDIAKMFARVFFYTDLKPPFAVSGIN